jgi:hypothetical protein
MQPTLGARPLPYMRRRYSFLPGGLLARGDGWSLLPEDGHSVREVKGCGSERLEIAFRWRTMSAWLCRGWAGSGRRGRRISQKSSLAIPGFPLVQAVMHRVRRLEHPFVRLQYPTAGHQRDVFSISDVCGIRRNRGGEAHPGAVRQLERRCVGEFQLVYGEIAVARQAACIAVAARGTALSGMRMLSL